MRRARERETVYLCARALPPSSRSAPARKRKFVADKMAGSIDGSAHVPDSCAVIRLAGCPGFYDAPTMIYAP